MIAWLALAGAALLPADARAEGLRHTERASEPAAAAPAARPQAIARSRSARQSQSAAPGFDAAWLYSYVERLVGGAGAPRRAMVMRRDKPRADVALRPAAPALPPQQAEPNRSVLVDAERSDRVARPSPAAGASPSVLPPAPTSSAVVTGAITPAAMPAARSEAQAAPVPRIQRLDAQQAARDLPKLELASRVYGETRLSGDRVFQLSRDWLVLERARDALNDADRAAAEAAGFDAAAYVNDQERLVVVAIAGTQDLRRDFLANDVWRALIRAQAPQQFYLATQYIRYVRRRYVGAGYRIECVGHSLGGGACAYAAAEIGIEGRVINPISAGRIDPRAERLITNYVVDGEIATIVYGARGNRLTGSVLVVDDGSDRSEARARVLERWGALGGIAVIVEAVREAIADHRVDTALDRIARQAGVSRIR